MEVLQFTFQTVWHFFGVLALIYSVLHGIAAVVAAFKGDLYE